MVLLRPTITHPNPNTDPPNPEPICLLCGVKRKWIARWNLKTKQHMLVPSHEIEEAYFTDCPRLWSMFCRANRLIRTVIKEPNRKFRLTGINMLRFDHGPYYTPTDPAMARIGGPRYAGYDDTHFTQFYAASITRQPRHYEGSVVGYIVHAHCWALFSQIEGLKLNKAALAQVVQTCRKFWHRNELWGAYGSILDSKIGPSEPYFNAEYGCDFFLSPLVVGAVQEAIIRAKEENLRFASTKAIVPLCRFSGLPLEIAVLIAELVCPVQYTPNDVNDMREMLLAFRWKLPDWFWRKRWSKHLFIELGAKGGTAPVDWLLWLNLLGLVSDPDWFRYSGLANRERVVGIILALENIYVQ
ncbi:hypothetical protein N7467_004195 [Penicillium canescens]|nr:hypothetical protein N7467_004195 [Penicillium canescens]